MRVCLRPGIVDDIIGAPRLFRLGHLGGDARPGSRFVDAVAAHQSGQLPPLVHGHQQHRIDLAVGAGLEQQWGIVHNQAGTLPGQSGKALPGQGGNGRMGDTIQRTAGLWIGEYPLRQPLPVYLPVGLQRPRAETLHNVGEDFTAGPHDLSGQRIGADHRSAHGTQHFGHRTLAAGDTARQTQNQHCCILSDTAPSAGVCIVIPPRRHLLPQPAARTFCPKQKLFTT
jgi:hypothetical protein